MSVPPPKADIRAAHRGVRYGPGTDSCTAAKRRGHSIGASEHRQGTVRASAFAVLRLMINSNFVACCTGRSAGFLPFEHPTGIDPDLSEGILRNQVAPARATWRDFSRVAGTLGLLRLMICATNSLLN